MSKRFVSFILVCTAALILGLVFILNFRFQPGWDFRNNLWGPAHLLVNHQSPYQVSVLFDNSNAVWLPMVIGMLFPLGYFPLQQAFNLWLLINIMALILVVFFSAESFKVPPRLLVIFIFFLALFPSVISLLVLGQISLLICLAMLVVIRFDRQMHPMLTGFLLAFSLSKPQLSFLFVFFYLVWLAKDRGIKSAGLVSASTAAAVILTCIPLFFFYPNWVPDLISNITGNASWLQPTLYSLFLAQPGPIGLIFRLLFFLSGLLLVFFISIRLSRRTTLLWAIALTVVFSPYIWSWDFVLLFPILIFTFSKSKEWTGKLLLGTGYIVCTMLFIGMRLGGKVSDEQSWWVPLFLIAVTLFSAVRFNPRKLLLYHS